MMKNGLLRRVSFATLLFAALPASAADQSPSDAKRISPTLRPFVDDHFLAGAVTLVADKDRVLSLESVGYADIAADKPMRTDALFWIASQTKPVTATALMILVDEGKLGLDDPVEKYFPEFKDQWLAVEQDGDHVLLRKPKHRMLIRHMLDHTSGLPHFTPLERPPLGPDHGVSLRDSVLSYAMTPLQSEPGSKWRYCNAGFNTAGRIIELVGGKPYDVFLEERLFRPLGMKDTTFSPNKEQLARLAKSYKPNANRPGLEATPILMFEDDPMDDRKRRPFPAGGLFSTANDLLRFCQMLMNGGRFEGHRILSEAAVKEMTTKQTEIQDGVGYGLGLWVNPDGSFGHNGAYSTELKIDPKRDLITVFLVQHAGFPGDGNKIHEIYEKFNKQAIEVFSHTAR